jgi:hypothetical protein
MLGALVNTARPEFIDRFGIPMHVHLCRCGRAGRRNRRSTLHEASMRFIQTKLGALPISSGGFAEIVQPVVEELHKRLPKGKRPSAHLVDGKGNRFDDHATKEFGNCF